MCFSRKQSFFRTRSFSLDVFTPVARRGLITLRENGRKAGGEEASVHLYEAAASLPGVQSCRTQNLQQITRCRRELGLLGIGMGEGHSF